MTRNRAAVVMTAVARLPDGSRCGHWLAEVAHPWLALEDAGFDVVALSTRPGSTEPTGVDMSDSVQRRFCGVGGVITSLRSARRPEFYLPEDFAAVVYAGGVGALFDLAIDSGLAEFSSAVVNAGGMLAACGFGVGGLLGIVDDHGAPLLDERAVTAPSAEELELLGLADVVPFQVDSELLQRGARPVHGPPLRAHVVRDGRLITGQNPASAAELSACLLTATSEL